MNLQQFEKFKEENKSILEHKKMQMNCDVGIIMIEYYKKHKLKIICKKLYEVDESDLQDIIDNKNRNQKHLNIVVK